MDEGGAYANVCAADIADHGESSVACVSERDSVFVISSILPPHLHTRVSSSAPSTVLDRVILRISAPYLPS